ILEEGKAFELGGKRWHIDCFRCNTCGTLLDSDANILLLGDGSLICNNCTYSCSFCGNKIEDIAILTGDQAFCASCFKCRNCKRQIENLRYARTSQGIFCMECHDSLMARRRKRTARNAIQQQHGRSKPPGHANMHLDKSLPSLPPAAKPGSRRGSPARPGNLNGTVRLAREKCAVPNVAANKQSR
ncbi:Rho-type gtpase-activating protein, partial [Ascosphaera atra]